MSQHFLPSREKGQGLVEYALILVLVSIAVIAIMIFLGGSVGDVFEEVSTNLSGQTIEGVGTEYVIGSFSVTTTGEANCTVNVSDFNVTVYEDGERVGANVGVPVNIAIPGGGTTSPPNITTNANGVASVSGFGTNGNCTGQVTVSISGGGNSRSVNY